MDVLVDPSLTRILGFEVLGRDGMRRFAPWGACDVGATEIGVPTALSLLGAPELDYYRARASSLADLRRLAVREDGQVVGTIDDLLVDPDGGVVRVVVRGPDRRIGSPRSASGPPRGSVTLAMGRHGAAYLDISSRTPPDCWRWVRATPSTGRPVGIPAGSQPSYSTAGPARAARRGSAG